eukprot:g1081.t1
MQRNNIPYETVEVNPLSKDELKLIDPERKFKTVPVAIIPNGAVIDSLDSLSPTNSTPALMNESRDIIATLTNHSLYGKDSRISEGQAMTYMSGIPETEEEKLLIEYAYKELVNLITVNLYSSFSDSWATFEYIADHPSWSMATQSSIRIGGTVLMRFVASRMKKKYNIPDNERDALVNALKDFINNKAGKSELADTVVYGMLSAMRGVGSSSIAIEEVAGRWIDSMKQKNRS